MWRIICAYGEPTSMPEPTAAASGSGKVTIAEVPACRTACNSPSRSSLDASLGRLATTCGFCEAAGPGAGEEPVEDLRGTPHVGHHPAAHGLGTVRTSWGREDLPRNRAGH